MKSNLEILKLAKKVVEENGVEALDSLIKDEEARSIETATLEVEVETR